MASNKHCPTQLIAFTTPFVYDGEKVRYNVNSANGMGPDEPLSIGETHTLHYDPCNGKLKVHEVDAHRVKSHSVDTHKLRVRDDAVVDGDITADTITVRKAIVTEVVITDIVVGGFEVTGTIIAGDLEAKRTVTAGEKVSAPLVEADNVNVSESLTAGNGVFKTTVEAERIAASQHLFAETADVEGYLNAGSLSTKTANVSELLTADSLKVLHDAEVDGDVKTQNIKALFDVSGDTGNFAISVSAGSGNFITSKIDETLVAKHIDTETISAKSATVQDVTVTGSATLQGDVSVSGDITATNVTATNNLTAGNLVKGATGEFQNLIIGQLSGTSANFTTDVQVDGVLHAGAVEVDQFVASPEVRTGLLNATIAKITDLDVGESFLAKTGRVNSLEASLAKFTDVSASAVEVAGLVQASLAKFSGAVDAGSVASEFAQLKNLSSDTATVKDVTVTGSATLQGDVGVTGDVTVTNLIATNDVTAGNKISASVVAAGTATSDYASAKNANVDELLTVGQLKAAGGIAADTLVVNKVVTANAYTKFNAAQVVSGGDSIFEFNGDFLNGTVPTILGLAPLTGPLTVALVSSGGIGGVPFLPGTTVVVKDATQQFQPDTEYNIFIKSVGGKIEHRDRKGRLHLSENGVYVLNTTGGSVTLTNVKGSVQDQDVWSIVAEVHGNRRSHPLKPCHSGHKSDDDCDCSHSHSECSSSESELDD